MIAVAGRSDHIRQLQRGCPRKWRQVALEVVNFFVPDVHVPAPVTVHVEPRRLPDHLSPFMSDRESVTQNSNIRRESRNRDEQDNHSAGDCAMKPPCAPVSSVVHAFLVSIKAKPVPATNPSPAQLPLPLRSPH